MIGKKNGKKKFIIIGLSILLIGFLAISYIIGDQVFKASTQLVTNESTKETSAEYWERQGMDPNEFRTKYKIEKIEIKSSLDGHTIPADYIYAEGVDTKDHKTAVIVHGLWDNRESTFPVSQIFLDMGYNTIAYDQRSSGENTAQYTTFGYWESHDLKDYVIYADKEIKDNQDIVVWGMSFGGATVGTALGDKDINRLVDYAILDCPVSSMRGMSKVFMKNMENMPVDYALFMGNIFIKARLGFGYADTEVTEYVKDTTIPTLIFNTKGDKVVPYTMGEDIYNAIKSENKELITVEDSNHVQIWIDHHDMYRWEIAKFINANEIVNN